MRRLEWILTFLLLAVVALVLLAYTEGCSMASGYPDWTRAIRLLGIDASGNPITILLDADGKLYSRIMGQDAGGVLRAVRVDDDGQMVMVPRGESGHYMLVDSDGYMTTLIKGYDGATYRTVKTDSEGRLTAFMVDSVDAWGQLLEVGNAELAARLGSLRVYDRRGQSILEHDFGDGWGAFVPSGSGTGHTETLNPVYRRSGGYSIKLVGGSDGDGYASVETRLPALPNAAFGTEALWSIDTATYYVQMDIDYWNGTHRYWCKVRYNVASEYLQLYDEDGNWATIESGAKVDVTATMFNYWKLVADAATGDYVRVLLNGVESDITAYPIKVTGAVTAPRMRIVFCNYSRPTDNDVVYLDSIAATVVEPA